MNAKTKEKKSDTTAADRHVLDSVRELTESLIGMGKYTPEEIRYDQDVRAALGAKPLRLDDARVFDASTVAPIAAFTPEAVRELREREGASQAVMAAHLGVATKTLGQWERGQRKPEGPAAKLLTLVQAHGLQYLR